MKYREPKKLDGDSFYREHATCNIEYGSEIWPSKTKINCFMKQKYRGISLGQ